MSQNTSAPVKVLKVGGFTPFSATDFPGKLAAVVYVQGCPWRCGYCHNPHLQHRAARTDITWANVVSQLKRRVGLIDAVVFSGGEPTMDPALPQAMGEVRALGFGVGLHTAGVYLHRLEEVLPLVDWVGLDIKGTPSSYDAITGVRNSARSAFDAAAILQASGVAFECRTTVHPDWHPPAEVRALAHTLSRLGVKNYALQAFRDPNATQTRVADCLNYEHLAHIKSLFSQVTVRR